MIGEDPHRCNDADLLSIIKCEETRRFMQRKFILQDRMQGRTHRFTKHKFYN